MNPDEGGSYIIDKKGNRKLVEQTKQAVVAYRGEAVHNAAEVLTEGQEKDADA